MADIKKRKRTFVVFIDKGYPGARPIEEEVTVEAGEDADAVCGDILQTMMSNEIDSGWCEKEKVPRG